MKRSQAPSTRIALGLSLALLIAALGLTLSQSPPTVASWNSVEAAVEFDSITSPFSACQANEVLPQGTAAIRLSLDSVLGPRVKVRALSGGRVLTHGERGSGWTAADVTVPVQPVTKTATNVSICFAFLAKNESVGLTGQRLASREGATSNRGLLRDRIPQAGRSAVVVVARFLGCRAHGFWPCMEQRLDRALLGCGDGDDCGDRVLACNGARAGMRSAREGERWNESAGNNAALGVAETRTKEGWICALVACLNATCWSFITPPFQIPDEPDHYSYVEQLALTGEPPSSDKTGEYAA